MIPGLTAAWQIQTNRFLTALSQERNELQVENEQTTVALEALAQAQSNCIQAQSDEIALLKAQVEQLKHEAENSREALQAEMRFRQEQQKQMTELRQKNSQLTSSDQTLKELVAIFKVLDERKQGDWPENNLDPECADLMDNITLVEWHNDTQNAMKYRWEKNHSHIPTPPHWEPILHVLQKAAKEAAP